MAMSCCENLRVEFYKQFRKLAIFFFYSSEEKEDSPPTWTTLQRRRSKARYVCVTKRGLHSCPLRFCCFVMALRICKLYVHILLPPPYIFIFPSRLLTWNNLAPCPPRSYWRNTANAMWRRPPAGYLMDWGGRRVI